MRLRALLAALTLATSASACTSAGAHTPAGVTPPPPAVASAAEPDRVVNVARRCGFVAPEASTAYIRRFGDEACSLAPSQHVINDRLEVTVRSSVGGAYVVTLPANATVTVGQAWP